MSTNPPPLLDFESLLVPIPGPNPAGSPLPYANRERLEAWRREINPDDYDANDPQRPTTAKSANWSAIVELSQEILIGTSKDLSVAARLTEALVKQNGLPGLRDGLHVLRLLVETCWDRLSPALEEDDDLEMRAAPFQWLDDPNRGASFPNTVRAVPLVVGEGVGYGWQDWKRSQAPRSPLTPETFDKARQATPLEFSREGVELLSAARAELDGMVQALNDRMGNTAPAMLGLRQAIEDCQLLAQQILQLNASATPAGGALDTGPEPADASGAMTEAEPGAPSASRQAVTRAQIYFQLSEAANALRRLEPHSPIPYLLERAVTLGALSFPDLMKELIRDANVLSAMSRELGIKDPSQDQ